MKTVAAIWDDLPSPTPSENADIKNYNVPSDDLIPDEIKGFYTRHPSIRAETGSDWNSVIFIDGYGSHVTSPHNKLHFDLTELQQNASEKSMWDHSPSDDECDMPQVGQGIRVEDEEKTDVKDHPSTPSPISMVSFKTPICVAKEEAYALVPLPPSFNFPAPPKPVRISPLTPTDRLRSESLPPLPQTVVITSDTKPQGKRDSVETFMLPRRRKSGGKQSSNKSTKTRSTKKQASEKAYSEKTITEKALSIAPFGNLASARTERFDLPDVELTCACGRQKSQSLALLSSRAIVIFVVGLIREWLLYLDLNNGKRLS